MHNAQGFTDAEIQRPVIRETLRHHPVNIGTATLSNDSTPWPISNCPSQGQSNKTMSAESRKASSATCQPAQAESSVQSPGRKSLSSMSWQKESFVSRPVSPCEAAPREISWTSTAHGFKILWPGAWRMYAWDTERLRCQQRLSFSH